MSRIIQVHDTDYKVKVRSDGLDTSTGTITLDVGIGGLVKINGDLTVEGLTTTVNTNNTTIQDNRIVLNTGQTGTSGITPESGTAGVTVYRGGGNYPDASVLFDESVKWYDNQTNTTKSGGFVFKIGELLSGIRTNSIVTDNKNRNLNLLGPSPTASEIGTGTAVVSVKGVPDYDERINRKLSVDLNQSAFEEAIPNVKWVNGAIATYFNVTPPTFIKKDNSILEIFDTDSSDSETKLSLLLNAVTIAQFKSTLVTFDNLALKFSEGLIETTAPGLDLTLNSASGGSVKIGSDINPSNLRVILSTDDPSQESNSVKIYTKTENYGGSGIYFVNNQATRDELVSRRKALAYSMIF
jgi:hypothetical protein